MKDEFHERIFRRGKRGLFEVLDRQNLLDLFKSEEWGQARMKPLVYGAYTASVLLSNAWLKPPKKKRPIEIRLPKEEEQRHD